MLLLSAPVAIKTGAYNHPMSEYPIILTILSKIKKLYVSDQLIYLQDKGQSRT